MAQVQLRALRRQFLGSSSAALSELDLTIAPGELMVLVGPSGCGKSTALRLIAGLDEPDAGEVLIDGRPMQNVPPQDRDVAMVFQGYALYPHMRVRDILAFPLKMRRVPRSERRSRVQEAAELLSIDKLLDRHPDELSGGERQRVAMGRALVRHPKVFLFDEPLSNLDAALRAELRVEIGALVRRVGATTIYVTHDHVEAMTLGDRIAVLRQGKLEQVGSPREIYEHPRTAFVASFLGSPSMNLNYARKEQNELVSGTIRIRLGQSQACPSELRIGVRPEHIHIGPAPQSGWITAPALVQTLEPLGAETYVYVDADGASLRLRLPGFDVPKRGETITVRFRPEHVHLFQAQEPGQTLSLALEAL